MNNTTLLRSIIEKENIARNYKRKAQDMLQLKGGPSEEQCMLLQRAADLESEMASMTIGAEKDSHIREMNRLDTECSLIRAKLGKTAPRKSEDEKKSAPGKDGEKPNNSSAADDRGKTQEEIEIDRAVRTWYKEAPGHGFEDVAGMEELKDRLNGCIADMRADKLRQYLHIPKLNSFFFVGPPGCGKTFICEAFAHELMDKDYKFISILGSDIISKYAGTAEKSVTRLFEEAMQNAPCIVFIDEIDSLCKNRSLPNLPEYAANITTSFLTGYNKIHSADADVIFMAATNYPNRVDAAMLDRAEIIRLPLPDKEARKAAFRRGLSYKEETGEGEEKKVEFKPIVELKNGLSYDIMAEKSWRFNYRDIERFTSAVKRKLFHELIDFYKDDELAVEKLKSGDEKLTKKKFDEIIAGFKPSPKEEILRDLLTWEKKVQSMADIAETDLSRLYDCELPADALVDVLLNMDVNAEPEKAEETAPAEQELPESKEPVYPLKDEIVPDPMTGVAEIAFAVGAREVNHLVANVDGDEVMLEETEEGYVFDYQPNDEETEIKVNVKDDEGFIGSFTVDINRAIKENDDFDI